MKHRIWALIWFVAATWLGCLGQDVPKLEKQRPTPWHDPSPHRIQFLTVDKNVQLEVLDWGGSGRPLVLLAGLGNTAHVFDDFAPKLTAECHVYGITRRGFGASSDPENGYSADRLGDDVLAVLDSLNLNRPVLAGHSIAGAELSSVGTRHPERTGGLIYFDAARWYAYYDKTRGDFNIDLPELQTKLAELPRIPYDKPEKWIEMIDELLKTDLPRFERVLEELQRQLKADQLTPPPTIPTDSDMASFPSFRSFLVRDQRFAMPEAELRQVFESTPDGRVGKLRAQPHGEAIMAGARKYSDMRVPILAIYAMPGNLEPPVDADPAVRAATESSKITDAQAKAFESGVPTARVVRLTHADHYVFLSNEEDVLREMKAFLASLP